MSDALKTRERWLGALRTSIRAQLTALESMVGASRDEATNAESRPENKYDTRALEASYLAAGQGQRLADLRELTSWIEALGPEPHARARLGSFVEMEDERGLSWVLLAPQGGHRIDEDGVVLQLVGASSPLGRVLLGMEAGDATSFSAPAGERELELVQLL